MPTELEWAYFMTYKNQWQVQINWCNPRRNAFFNIQRCSTVLVCRPTLFVMLLCSSFLMGYLHAVSLQTLCFYLASSI